MDVTPARSFSAPSTFVPLAASSASVFFTTVYLAPELRSSLRNSKSCATVSLLYVVTMIVETFCRSLPSFSTCSCFLARVTAMSVLYSCSCGSDILVRTGISCGAGALARECSDTNVRATQLRLRRRFDRSRIQRDPGAHRRTQIAALDVLPFCYRRLRLDYTGDQRQRVLDQLLWRERNLSHGNVDERSLVGAEFDFAGFHFL